MTEYEFFRTLIYGEHTHREPVSVALSTRAKEVRAAGDRSRAARLSMLAGQVASGVRTSQRLRDRVAKDIELVRGRCV